MSSLSSAQLFMLRVGLVVGGGGFIFGYDIGVVRYCLCCTFHTYHADYPVLVHALLVNYRSLVRCRYWTIDLVYPVCKKDSSWRFSRWAAFSAACSEDTCATTSAGVYVIRYIVACRDKICGY